MNRLAIILLACLLGVAGAASAFIVGMEQLAETHEQSSFSYTVQFEPSEELTNVTLFIPLPNPTPASFGGNFSVSADDAQDWSISAQETEVGPMLVIVAPTLRPGATGAGSLVTFTWEPEERINTVSPEAGEPLLLPRGPMQQATCEHDHPVEWEGTLRCQDYGSAVFATYNATENATLGISVDLVGQNEWWSLGWSGNQYRDSVSVELRGPTEGWQVARGTTISGEGRYR